MGWPQITWIALTAAGLGMAIIKHGEPKSENYNFFSSAIATAIIAWILYCGGFFA